MIKYREDSVTVYDSYLLEKEDIYIISEMILLSNKCPECIKRRSVKSIANEIMAHNLLYQYGMYTDRTKDTDIDDEPWWALACYSVLALAWRITH